MKFFSMFSGIGGFELGIKRAEENYHHWITTRDDKGKRELPSTRKDIINGRDNEGCLSPREPASLHSGCLQQEGAGHLSLPDGTSPQLDQGDRGFLSGKETEGIRGCRTDIEERPKGIESYDCIGYSEIDKYAIQVHERNFGYHSNCGDARKARYCKLPDFDLVVAGFPCQAFSIAGQRKGFADARGTLFFEIARLLRDKRPGYLLLENVKGLLSHDEGKTFQRILGILADLGYDLQWQVLNSKDFGVPQNRERVFIVGSLGDRPRPEVFPLGEVDGVPQQKNDKRQGSSYMIHNVYGGFGEEEPRIFEETSPTIRTPAEGGHLPMVAQALQTDGQLRSGSSFNTDRPQSSRNIRRLTPVECERLQGFPDNWTEGISDTQRYKCLGNAVTVNVIEAIMTKFMRCNCIANAEVT